MKFVPPFRRIVFWLHLLCGLTAGLVILVMSVTGVLLSFERQILEVADTPVVPAPSSGAERLSIEQFLEKASVSAPSGAALSTLTLGREIYAPVSVTYGRDVTAYLDPWTGQTLPPGAPGLRKFFRSVTEWHRALAFSGDSRNTGRSLTGAANLVFLFLVLSGIYLWFPRKWSWSAFRPSLWFRGKLSGRARDWNRHNVFGFWASLPLFFIVITGTFISYPWASDLLYRLTGSSAPPTGPGAPPARSGTASATSGFHGLNAAWAAAETLSPGWQTLSLRLPAAKEAVFTVMGSHRGRPDLRSTLTLDPKTAAVLSAERFDDFNAGRKLRTWSRWIHTGEAGGVTGQIIAALASAAAVFLVWTGFALAIRRFAARWFRARVPSESAGS